MNVNVKTDTVSVFFNIGLCVEFNMSKSSGRWMNEHFSDVYVLKAQQMGYRSRASFKLLEINEKDQLLCPGYTVLDLGAAPGGWSQIAAKFVGDSGVVIASDILNMESLDNVQFIQGDFTQESVYDVIMNSIPGSVDLVMSDMAPNMSGVKSSDQANAMYLVELALDIAQRTLKPGGNFVVKVFQGEGIQEYLKAMRGSFDKVVTRKPESSRARSREVYLVGKMFCG